MVTAWLLTLPSAAIVGALAARVAQTGTTGTVVVGVVGTAIAGGIYALSRRQPVGPNNVNDVPARRLQPAGAQV
jgi:PiT family inorganic phosphate transporter